MIAGNMDFRSFSMIKQIILIMVFMLGVTGFMAQESQRTPEQEAANQTEKMQKELNLSSEQTKAVYEIQLKYAKERQNSNSRSDALQRVKNKRSELKKVLQKDQFDQLQNKRLERNNTPINNSLRTNQRTVRPMESGTREYNENRENRVNQNKEMNQRQMDNNRTTVPSSMRYQEYRNSHSAGGSRNR